MTDDTQATTGQRTRIRELVEERDDLDAEAQRLEGRGRWRL